ncbi:hypothetical protein MK131_03395 [Candidatus Poribacteria bacterium]|nr:hypothetical protein [Candidatus Poribacteria bacterium]
MIIFTTICCLVLLLIGWAGVSIFNAVALKSDEVKGSWKRGIFILVVLAAVPCIILIIIGFFVATGILDSLEFDFFSLSSTE